MLPGLAALLVVPSYLFAPPSVRQTQRTPTRTRLLRLPLAAALALLAACGGELAGETACDWPPPADTAGWQVVDATTFVLKLPPGYRDTRPADFDLRSEWRDGDHVVAVSFAGDNAPAAGAPPGGWRCEPDVGGFPSTLAVAPPGAAAPGAGYNVSVAWAGMATLRATGPAGDSARVARLLTAVRTLRMRTVVTPADSLRITWEACERMARSADPAARRLHRESLGRGCPRTPPPPVVYEQVR